jgi:hypothetical protein
MAQGSFLARVKIDQKSGATHRGFVEPGRGKRNIDAPFEVVDHFLRYAAGSKSSTSQCARERPTAVGRSPCIYGLKYRFLK